MGKYQSDTDLLSEVETFEPKAFAGDNEWSQELCNFVLALALVYNDFKDTVFAQTMLFAVAPNDLEQKTPEVGQFAGIHIHLLRIVGSLFHELLDLLRKKRDLVNHERFELLVENLPPEARDAWRGILEAAFQKPSCNPVAMLLVRVRNKVSSHYDPEEIGRGYARAFLEDNGRQPYISRGASMAAARFYFADAAAEAYITDITDAETAREFFSAASPLMNQINHALRELVARFVNARGFGWRKPGPPR